METKKTRKVMIMLMTVAILIFAAVISLNSHLDYKQKNKQAVPKDELVLIAGAKQSYISSNEISLTEDDVYVGNKKADLKIFVYEDYTDIFSAEFNKTLIQAKADFGDDVLFIYRPYSVRHDNVSITSALALSCASEQRKGETWRQRDFQAILDNGMPIDSFDVWIDELKLSKDVFNKCLTNQSKKERIEGLMSQATAYSVYGAPTVFVGDEMIVGARPYQAFTDSNGDEIEGLKQVIERQLK